MVELLFTKALK